MQSLIVVPPKRRRSPTPAIRVPWRRGIGSASPQLVPKPYAVTHLKRGERCTLGVYVTTSAELAGQMAGVNFAKSQGYWIPTVWVREAGCQRQRFTPIAVIAPPLDERSQWTDRDRSPVGVKVDDAVYWAGAICHALGLED